MHPSFLQQRETRAYLFLTTLVICGLIASLITSIKIIHLGQANIPFANIVFSIFTYPIVDCICELWGKQAARQTLWLGLISQLLVTLMIQLSIVTPQANFWHLQLEYQQILSTSSTIVTASFVAFSSSQLLDIVIYQRIKELSKGKWLWLRSNVSTYLGQIVDTFIFVAIVFSNSSLKYNILFGSLTVKIILSLLMTPVVYLIVFGTRYYVTKSLFIQDWVALMTRNVKDRAQALDSADKPRNVG